MIGQIDRRLSFIGKFLVVAFLLTRVALAQDGTISGRVTDPAGGVVHGVKITVTNVETENKAEAQTNEAGFYVFPLLPPGHYQLSAEMSGFKRTVHSGIKLDVQQVRRIDFELQVGGLTQEDNVEARAPLLESSTSSLGQHIEGKQIMELPLLGRNPYALATLVPGARVPVSQNNLPADMGSSQHISINGARGQQNEFLLDGAPNTNPGPGGPTIFPSVDSVQEFRVTTNNYSAEYGRAAGGIFNVVTKSGTNQWRGSLYEFLRNDALTANDFFSNKAGQKRPPFRFNQFGSTLGGPVIIPRLYRGENRTFIFGSYEGARQRQGVTFVGTVPTELQRQGDFSQTRNTRGELIRIYDPLTSRPDPNRPGQFLRDPFPDNRILPQRIDPVARTLLQFFPPPNTAGQPVTGVSNFISAAPQSINKDLFTIRLDHRVSDRQQIYGRFSYDHTPWIRPNAYGNIGSPTFGPQFFDRRGVVLDDSYALSPTRIAHFKYGFNRMVNVNFPLGYPFDLTRLGFPTDLARALPLPGIPAIQISGFGGAYTLQNIGNPSALGSPRVILFGMDTHAWQGSVTQTRGRHTTKLGGEFRLIRNNHMQVGGGVNRFSFTPAFTQGPNPAAAGATAGFSLASFLLGVAESRTSMVTVVPAVALQEMYYGLYLQDDFKVTPKLTLNLGLRYDYQSPRTERFNQLTNFNFQAPPPLAAPGLNLRGGLEFVGVGGQPRAQWEPDRNNFAPRFGFAYSLTSKMAIRGGFGLFYVPTLFGTGTGPTPIGLSGFSATTNFAGTRGGFLPANLLRDPFPQGINQPTGNRLGLGTLLGETIGFVDRARRTPYSEQWNLNVQQELFGHILLEAAYVGSRGVKLLETRQLNQLSDEFLALGNRLIDPGPNPFFGQITAGVLSGATVSRGQLLRPFPHFLDVQAAHANWGASTYHAGQLKVERRFTRGFSLLASYTFSKLLDNYTGTFQGETLSGTEVQNWNNLKAERSISALDTRQRFVVGAIWELPFGAGRRYLAKGWASPVLGGWQVEGITTLASGTVLGVTSASNPLASLGVPNPRPNWDGRNPALSQPSIDRWFNTSVFSPPLPFTFGNAPRTVPGLRSDGTRNVDFSLIKNTRAGERLNVQFRAEFFNLFNTPRFDLPNTSLGTSNFGVVGNQINQPRIVQFGLKLLF